MTTVDHAAEAQQHIDWAHAQQGDEGQFEYTVRDNALIAQAEATLALVEQQRIANLLALEASLEPHDYDLRARLGAQIAKGLGVS